LETRNKKESKDGPGGEKGKDLRLRKGGKERTERKRSQISNQTNKKPFEEKSITPRGQIIVPKEEGEGGDRFQITTSGKREDPF